MALWECLDCGTLYAPGMTACPFDLSTDYREFGSTGVVVPSPELLTVTGEIGDAIQRIGVPLYIYPDWFTSPPRVWDAVMSPAPYVRYLIANVDSGPDAALNTDFSTQLARAQASGVKVLGYVSTSYAAVPYATMLADVHKWIDWYNVDGIFLDETSYNSNQAHYQQIYDAIKAIDDNLTVVANPGLGAEELMSTTADIFMSFEGVPADYRLRPDVAAPAWERTAPSWRFWHLVHTVADLTEAQEMLELSQDYRAGTIFITDQTMPNPWLGLPVDNDIWLAQLAQCSSGGEQTDTVVTANTQTGTAYTLVLADAEKAIEMNNAAANAVTVPPNASVAFPVGTVIPEILQLGAGQTSIVAGVGVTLLPDSPVTTRAQYSVLSLRKRATNVWVVSGDFT